MRAWLRVPLKIVGVVLVAGLAVQIVVGVAFGSDVSDARKYGKVGVPGHAILHLPAGTLDVSLMEVTGSGVDVPHGLGMSVVPLEKGAPVPVRRDLGGPFGGNGRSSTVAYRRVFKADVPHAGAYRVTSAGDTGDRIYALEFGHAPLAIGVEIWEFTGLAALAALLVWAIVRALGSIRAAPSRP